MQCNQIDIQTCNERIIKRNWIFTSSPSSLFSSLIYFCFFVSFIKRKEKKIYEMKIHKLINHIYIHANNKQYIRSHNLNKNIFFCGSLRTFSTSQINFFSSCCCFLFKFFLDFLPLITWFYLSLQLRELHLFAVKLIFKQNN